VDEKRAYRTFAVTKPFVRNADYTATRFRFSMSDMAICHQLSWRLDYFRIGDKPDITQRKRVSRYQS
jgi:hypothetical protein